MLEVSFYWALFYVMLALASATLLGLTAVTAPYGRYLRAGWGPQIPSWLGWLMMEAPAWIVVAVCFAFGAVRHAGVVPWVFFGIWSMHYVYRAFIYPFRRRDAGRLMPASVALMGVIFNLANGYLQGRGVFDLGPLRGAGWLLDPRFILGVGLFVTGYAINHHADAVLRGLRAPGETGYKIPRGGLYRWVSCPNYLGELLEWIGWAVAVWHPAGALFAFWTFANLAPRARSHHRWYQEKFTDYPAERKALIPFVW